MIIGEPLGPWWLERQRDPTSPDFQPGDSSANVTHRDWVELGAVGSHDRAVVDPRGLVTPHGAGWSIDWWIGADDRWHLPAREPAVRQQRVDAAPVVETIMRVPGGDAVHRAYVAQDRAGPVVVIEIENRSPVPFAVALAVVPYNPVGTAEIGRIELRGDVVRIDAVDGLHLGKPPARVAGGCATAVLDDVVGGAAGPPVDPLVVSCDEGAAAIALVYPLPHTASLRIAAPLSEARVRDRSPAVARLPGADAVASGWRTQVDRGSRIDLPDDRVRRAFEAARRDLLLTVTGDDVAPWPGSPLPFEESAVVLAALDVLGFHDEVGELLAALPDLQRLNGEIASAEGNLAANGAALRAIAYHWVLAGDDALIGQLVGPIAKAAHWIEKRRTARRRPLVADARYVDLWWSISGLSGMAEPLRAVGQPDVADDVVSFASRLQRDVDRTLHEDRARLGTAVPPIRPGAPIGRDAIESLAVAPLGVADAAAMAGLAAMVDERWTANGLVEDPLGWGLSPARTLDQATVELAGDTPRAIERLHAVLDHASPVDTWPEVVHPRTRGGTRGSGHDAPTMARFCHFVRSMLVHDRPVVPTDGRAELPRLELCRLVPAEWLGQPWEVHGLPTAAGTLGFAVRWHGERPALLWELASDRHDRVRLSVPGLDPSWSTDAPQGEALLAPIPPPAQPPPDDGGSEASSSFA